MEDPVPAVRDILFGKCIVEVIPYWSQPNIIIHYKVTGFELISPTPISNHPPTHRTCTPSRREAGSLENSN